MQVNSTGANVETTATRLLARMTCMNLARIRPEQLLQRMLEKLPSETVEMPRELRVADNNELHELF